MDDDPTLAEVLADRDSTVLSEWGDDWVAIPSTLLEKAVEALLEQDRRITKAISYARRHDYRGNRPRWMNDIPAILGGTDG